MYDSPLTREEIKKRYPPEISEKLIKDPVHGWRAKTGIELIHKEPTKKEQKRIWKNWQEMTDDQKKISDRKSLELFGLTNFKHHFQILGQQGKS